MDANSKYELIFEGEIVEGMDLSVVKIKVARILKINLAKTEALLSDPPGTLADGLDMDSAEKLKRRICKAGLVCVIKKREPKTGEPPPLPGERHRSSVIYQPLPEWVFDNPCEMCRNPLAEGDTHKTDAGIKVPVCGECLKKLSRMTDDEAKDTAHASCSHCAKNMEWQNSFELVWEEGKVRVCGGCLRELSQGDDWEAKTSGGGKAPDNPCSRCGNEMVGQSSFEWTRKERMAIVCRECLETLSRRSTETEVLHASEKPGAPCSRCGKKTDRQGLFEWTSEDKKMPVCGSCLRALSQGMGWADKTKTEFIGNHCSHCGQETDTENAFEWTRKGGLTVCGTCHSGLRVGPGGWSKDDLLNIAKAQKGALTCVILYLLFTFLPPMQILMLPFGLCFICWLASSLKRKTPVFYVIGMLIPYVIEMLFPWLNIILLLSLSHEATSAIRGCGYKVGLFGASIKEIEAGPSQNRSRPMRSTSQAD